MPVDGDGEAFDFEAWTLDINPTGAAIQVPSEFIVPERLHGRAFGLLDAVDSWGFGGALIAGGALASAYGGRTTFALAGVGTLLVWLAAARVLRRTRPVLRPALAVGA